MISNLEFQAPPSVKTKENQFSTYTVSKNVQSDLQSILKEYSTKIKEKRTIWNSGNKKSV